MESHHDAPQVEPEKEQTMLHDSMVTVRLSEPPALHLDTTILAKPNATEKRDTLKHTSGQSTPSILLEEAEEDTPEESPRITMMDPNGNEVLSPSGSESAGSQNGDSRRESESSDASAEDVNWEELERTEEKEPRDESSDDVSVQIKPIHSERILIDSQLLFC